MGTLLCVLYVQKYTGNHNPALLSHPSYVYLQHRVYVQCLYLLFPRDVPTFSLNMCSVYAHRIRPLFFVSIGWCILSVNNDLLITQKSIQLVDVLALILHYHCRFSPLFIYIFFHLINKNRFLIHFEFNMFPGYHLLWWERMFRRSQVRRPTRFFL